VLSAFQNNLNPVTFLCHCYLFYFTRPLQKRMGGF
jgi:hypothetical protein